MNLPLVFISIVANFFCFELQYSGHLYFMTNRLRITNLKKKKLATFKIKYTASALRPEKNQQRGKSKKQKLLELNKVTAQIFFILMKSEKWRRWGKNKCIFLHNFKNLSKSWFLTVFGPDLLILKKFGSVTWTISNNFCFILFNFSI